MFLARCSNCDTAYKLADKMEGKKVRCARCQTKFRAQREVDDLERELESHRLETTPRKRKPADKPPRDKTPQPTKAEQPPMAELDTSQDDVDTVDTTGEDGFIFDDDEWDDNPEEPDRPVSVKPAEPKGLDESDFEYSLKEEQVESRPREGRLGVTSSPSPARPTPPPVPKKPRDEPSPKAGKPKTRKAKSTAPAAAVADTTAAPDAAPEPTPPRSNWTDPVVLILGAGLIVLSIATVALLYLALR